MPSQLTQNTQEFARLAAVAAAPRDGVGSFIEVVDEGQGTSTYHFASKLKGYRDWRWNVVIFQESVDAEATVSEVILMPGAESLIAPDWVPWSERLADYKALQAELEAQAALEAAEAADLESDEEPGEDEDADFEDEIDGDEVEAPATELEDAEESGAQDNDLAVSDPNQTDDAKDDSDSAGIWPKRLFGRRKGRVKGKDRNKGKNPKS